MITYVKGILDSIYTEGIVLDNHGIGYDIKTPSMLLNQLPPVGSEIKIFTYMYVREDALSLFGFSTKEDLKTFQLLIAVNGIGPKAGLAVLSTLTVDQLRFAVLSDDVKTISKTPGIGPKSAQRLIIELKDKMHIEDAFASIDMPVDQGVTGDIRSETAMALVSLGYSNSDALRAIKAVKDGESMDTETLLKAALKKIMTI